MCKFCNDHLPYSGMKRFLLSIFILLSATWAVAQGFEVSGLQENYRGFIGETIKAPVRIKNTTDRPLNLVLRKSNALIGSTQKSYFCMDGNCFEQRADDLTIRLEPGQSVNALQIVLEAGLVSGESSIRYIVFNKANAAESIEFDTNFIVEEKPEKQSIYNSKYITLHDVYPNPVVDYAFVDYKIQNDRVKARIVIHNILGNIVGEYNLPLLENKVKMRTEELSSGVYFYTLYIDNEGVLTRKLVVKN